MGYSVTVDIDGVLVTMTGADTKEMMTMFEDVGGDGQWLVNKVRERVAEVSAGDYVPPVRIAGSDVDLIAAEQAVRTGMSDPAPGPVQEDTGQPEDDSPWDSQGQPPDGPESDATAPEPDNPWAGTTATRKPPQRRSGPAQRGSGQRAAPARQPQAGSGGPRRVRGNFGDYYLMDLPDAPLCTGHSEPAAQRHWTDKNGKPRTAWKCPYDATDYRESCNFHKWPWEDQGN